MPTPAEIPFQQLLDALLDANTPFNPRYLYRLSDLDGAELAQFKETWPKIPAWRKQALIEDLETLGESDLLLSFEAVCSFALHDDEPKVRLPAVRALWEYEQPDLIPDFLEILTKDSQAEVRAAAATALGHYVYLGELEEISPEVLRVIEDQLLQAANQAEIDRSAPDVVRSAGLFQPGGSASYDRGCLRLRQQGLDCQRFVRHGPFSR